MREGYSQGNYISLEKCNPLRETLLRECTASLELKRRSHASRFTYLWIRLVAIAVDLAFSHSVYHLVFDDVMMKASDVWLTPVRRQLQAHQEGLACGMLMM